MNATVDVGEFVCSIIALATNRDPSVIQPQANLLDLNIDSFTLVSIVGQVEAVYDVEFTPDEILFAIEAADVSAFVDRLQRMLQRAPNGRSPPSTMMDES